MPRKPRSKSPTGYFHVTLRGNGGQLLFDDAEDRIAMLQILDAIPPQTQYRAYVQSVARCAPTELKSVSKPLRNEAILAFEKKG